MPEILDQFGVVAAKYDMTRDKTTETYLEALARFKYELGISELDYLQAVNGDDTVHTIAVKHPGLVATPNKPLLSTISWNTETLLGFYSVAPTTATSSVSGLLKSRLYTTSVRPRIALSFGYNIDSGTHESKVYTNTKGTIITGIQAGWRSSTSSRYLEYAIKITATTIEMVMSCPTTAYIFPMQLAVFDPASLNSNPVTVLKLADLFDTPGTEKIKLVFDVKYKPTRTIDIPPIDLSKLTEVAGSLIRWNEQLPEGTSVVLKAATSNSVPTAEEYAEVTSGGSVVSVDTPTTHKLFVKVELATTVPTITPEVNNLDIQVWSNVADNKIALVLPKSSRIRNARGNVTVEYDASKGNVSGQGAAIDSFIEEFLPTGLVRQDNPMSVDNVAATADVIATLFKIDYKQGQDTPTSKVTATADVTMKFTKSDIIDA